MQRQFEIALDADPRCTVLTLHGELDVSSSPELEVELTRVVGEPLVVVDLTDLDFIDSTGLGVLVKTHQRMHEDGNRFVLIEGGGQVRRLLELTGLTEQLTVAQNLDELLPDA